MHFSAGKYASFCGIYCAKLGQNWGFKSWSSMILDMRLETRLGISEVLAQKT